MVRLEVERDALVDRHAVVALDEGEAAVRLADEAIAGIEEGVRDGALVNDADLRRAARTPVGSGPIGSVLA